MCNWQLRLHLLGLWGMWPARLHIHLVLPVRDEVLPSGTAPSPGDIAQPSQLAISGQLQQLGRYGRITHTGSMPPGSCPCRYSSGAMRPRSSTQEAEGGFQARVFLPNNSPLRDCWGPVQPSPRMARGAAFVKAVALLHKVGNRQRSGGWVSGRGCRS